MSSKTGEAGYLIHGDGVVFIQDDDGDYILLGEPQAFELFQALEKKYNFPEPEETFKPFYDQREPVIITGECEDCGGEVGIQ